MKISRRFTKQGQDPFASVEYEQRTSRISNPDGSIVFEMTDAQMPRQWSQLATDIMVSKYFRKAGVPQTDSDGNPLRDNSGNIVTGPEKSAKQVIHRLAGCWRHWGEKYGYFDTAQDAQAFYDELAYMMLHQMCAPNSPQWFNTGLNFAYGITGPSQGHYYCDPRSGELLKSKDAYSHPQPHACFIQSVRDDLVGEGGIMDLWVREARLFKYGSGTGSNFSNLRGENEKLSGGGKSSGLMSFLRIGDRAAGAIKSGGTTRRAAKMCCLDLNHPDVEQFINWKVREELKVAAMAEGIKILPKDQQEQAKKMGLKLDYDFNGEAYYTVSGQNSNNSIRIPNAFFKAVEEDGDWNLIYRTSGKIAKTVKARDLWEQIAFAAWRCADPGMQYDDTINQWHTCPKSGRINASNPCVTGDTRVLTPGGIWRRIDQMIHLPARLITNLNGQEIHVTDGAFPTGTRDVFELKTAGGYKLTLTADHKIYTRQRGWVEAKDLKTTDEIRLPNKPAAVQEVGEPQDPRLFQLVGLFLSTASGSADSVCLDKALKDSDLVDTFAQYAHDNWGAGLYNDDYANAAMLEDGASDDSQLTTGNSQLATSTLSNRRLLSRLCAFIRTEGNVRRLGDEAFTAGLAAQKHLLRGLFTADGIIKNNSLQLSNQSLELLEDVQLILLGFGIKSSIFPLTTDNSQLATLSINASGDSPERRNLNSGQAAVLDSDGGAVEAAARTADIQRHGLRIDSGSLRSFGKHIALLPGKKLEQLAHAISYSIQPEARSTSLEASGNWDRFSTLTPRGKAQVFDLTEPVTSSFVANGLTVHNCSEYMFLDDTACNLASLNVLTFFDAETRRFDVEAYKHAIRIWTIVLEISVLMASFPSEAIARLSYKFRTLGLGYANLGAMLMQAGIAYDSETGRAICAALTSVLTGESYATSAEMAAELGTFPGYEENREDMLRVIRNHRRAAHNAGANPQPTIRNSQSAIGNYENLDIHPVPIDHTQFRDQNPLAAHDLLAAATECWDRALTQGERSGYRNAQTTVIAPTGCLIGKSLVATDRGLVRLDHLGDINGSRWQDVNFAVLTDAGQRQATKFFVNGMEATRRVTTRAGYAIEGTLKHRIKVIDTATGQWNWKYFADITPGDVVPLALGQTVGQPLPVSLPPLGELYWTTDYTTRVPRTVTPDLAEFVGYFMGDGSLHAKGLRLCVAQADVDVAQRLAHLGKTLFNIDTHATPKEGYIELAFHSVALTLWWEACGFHKLAPSPDQFGKGYIPRIPAALLTSNDHVVYGAFLKGLFEADGTVLAGVPMWCTAQGTLAEEVRSLMLTLGIPTSTKYDISGWGQGTLHVLRLRNASYVRAFREKIGFQGQRKQSAVRADPANEQAGRHDYIYLPPDLIDELVPAGAPLENAVALARKRHGGAITRRAAQTLLAQTADPRLQHALGFFYDTVDANDDAGEQMTYDLSVPDNVTYVANGFVSHNTIGLLMDCDTTGVEPDFALVKFKKLAGGGYFKIANQSLRPALVNLGYAPGEINDIMKSVLGTLTLHDAPHINHQTLKAAGLNEEELTRIEDSLPGMFELAFAFSPWTMGGPALARLGIAEAEWQAPGFNLLQRLGFTKSQISQATDIICGRGTIEGAPHIKPEHLGVFDCANKCGRYGTRYIPVEGHIRMMAAAQPFISGAISKTINLPNDATIEDIKNSYHLSWQLGLKANALYRDGSKLSQPLNVKSDEEVEKLVEEDDEENVNAAREEVASEVAQVAAIASDSSFVLQPTSLTSDNLSPAPHHTHIIEKIVERIVERPLRRRLPDTRHARTHKFDVAGHEGYITVGLYDDNSPGEVFITMAKEGSTIGGLMDTIATLVSVALQYGVPVESLVRKFEHVRFEPSGMTRNSEIPFAKSLVDYIFRWLAMEFIPGYRAANAPKRPEKKSETPVARTPAPSSPEPQTLNPEPSLAIPRPQHKKEGNGHGPRLEPDDTQQFAYGEETPTPRAPADTTSGVNLRTQIIVDPQSQQGSQLQADAPACDVCGSITVRSGTCYKCLNCGNSMGCS